MDFLSNANRPQETRLHQDEKLAISDLYGMERREIGFGCPISAVVSVKRAAASFLQIQAASGGKQDKLRQALTLGKPRLTL
jgi:hypothetical protein